MSLKDTIHAMQGLLEVLSKDLEKSIKGNKAASRRVRVCTVHLEKLAKCYRKESVLQPKKKAVFRKAKTVR